MKKNDWNDTMFTEIMGKSVEMKVIQLMLEWKDVDFTLNDFVKCSNTNRNRCYRVLKKLIEKKIVIPSRKVKTYTFFKLNKKSEIAKSLNDLFIKIITNKTVNKHG